VAESRIKKLRAFNITFALRGNARRQIRKWKASRKLWREGKVRKLGGEGLCQIIPKARRKPNQLSGKKKRKSEGNRKSFGGRRGEKGLRLSGPGENTN